MSLQVHDLSYAHPDKEVLFTDISFSLPRGERRALVGSNGVGKSTLLRILAKRIAPTSGEVVCDTPYLVPQHFGQFDGMTVAQALGVAEKLQALAAITNGDASEHNFTLLGDDWSVEERIAEAFADWELDAISPATPMSTLSGGEKTKVFLAGIALHSPSVVLMDEPTNHLDRRGRERLYDYIGRPGPTLLIVSHDRTLLNLLPSLLEMSPDGVRFYPMSYDAYRAAREAETLSRTAQLENRQKELAKAKKAANDAMERQQKHSARGERQSAKRCMARIVTNSLHDQSEASAARLGKALQNKLQAMNDEIRELRAAIPEDAAMKLRFAPSELRPGKLLIEAEALNHAYIDGHDLWKSPLNFALRSGERIRLLGGNGRGKSTLLRLITGALTPTAGEIRRTEAFRIAYLDQEYSLVDNDRTVYGQLAACNPRMPEHELKIRLTHLLFPAAAWDKKCGCLSGGEKMKLALCSLMVAEAGPDMIIADEPTNNIDIASMEILAATLRRYSGTLLVVSHDETFIREIGITGTMTV
mgnify:CR=1 FL=1|jgi:ATPase subunit of ABC transporter with duplicated ATPase domains